MKIKHALSLGAAVLLTLFVSGCETDGSLTARIQEKSAVYATLQPWEKNYIAKGVVSKGFTPDMVYMAMGLPSKAEPVNESGSKAELWTYNNYYPRVNAAQMRYSTFDTDAPYQPSRTEFTMISVDGNVGQPKSIPAGMGRVSQSISTTGGPQGQLPEPADLQSLTVKVLFRNDKVAQVGVNPN